MAGRVCAGAPHPGCASVRLACARASPTFAHPWSLVPALVGSPVPHHPCRPRPDAGGLLLTLGAPQTTHLNPLVDAAHRLVHHAHVRAAVVTARELDAQRLDQVHLDELVLRGRRLSGCGAQQGAANWAGGRAHRGALLGPRCSLALHHPLLLLHVHLHPGWPVGAKLDAKN